MAYFEGEVVGSCTWSTCETNEALLTELAEQMEKQMSLKCICYGEGVWFVYFDGELKDDAQVQTQKKNNKK